MSLFLFIYVCMCCVSSHMPVYTYLVFVVHCFVSKCVYAPSVLSISLTLVDCIKMAECIVRLIVVAEFPQGHCPLLEVRYEKLAIFDHYLALFCK